MRISVVAVRILLFSHVSMNIFFLHVFDMQPTRDQFPALTNIKYRDLVAETSTLPNAINWGKITVYYHSEEYVRIVKD